MTRLRMTKAALARRRQDLIVYQRALPSLELKRQQLVLDLAAERSAAARLADEAARLLERAGEVRFAADRDVPLEELLAGLSIVPGTESRLGVSLPVVQGLDWNDAKAPERESGLYPPWVVAALGLVQALAEVRARSMVAEVRVARMDQALRRAVQRINLLQQVLMPQARRDIAHIAQFLADGQRMAVARTKLLVARRGREARG